MRRPPLSLWNLVRRFAPGRRPQAARPRRPLHVERLEDRCTPANASGIISGTALINSGNGILDLAGVAVTLTGTTSQGTSINTSATTDNGGSFTFNNVLPGTYQLSAGAGLGLLGSPGFTNLSSSPGIAIVGGQNVSQNVVFRGLDPQHIFGNQFLSTTTAADFPFQASGGSGTALANFRPNNRPIVAHPIGSFTVPENGAPTFLDLAGYFSDPDITNSQVTFNTSAGPVHVTLLDTVAPQTVANFLDYVNSGAFNNGIYTRLVNNFVLQGGGAVLNTTASGSSLSPTVQPNPVPVENEHAASNKAGTLAMALNGNNINTASDEYFFNLVNNTPGTTNNLDGQNFTVFGQVADPTSQAVLNLLASAPTKNENSSPAATALPSVDLGNVPLNNYTGSNFPTDALASNFLLNNSFTIDRQDEVLSYSLVSDSNPGLVTASLTNEFLKLSYAAGQTGSSTLTVRATDRYGATVDTSFTVTVAAEPPVAQVTLSSPAANTLTATATTGDPSNLPVNLTYVWKLNGSTVRTTSNTSSRTDTLTLGTPLTSSDTVTVQVTPSDSLGTGTAATASVTAAPVVTNVTIAADNATATTTLTASPTTFDPEGNAVTNSFQWFQNGTALSGQTGQSLNLTALSSVKAGDKFTVQVTPSDGTFTGTAFTSKAVSIASTSPFKLTAPVVTDVGITADSATAATTLTATPISAGPDTYTFQWFKNGSILSGQTGQTLNLTALSGVTTGDKFSVNVIPSEGALSGATFSSHAVTINGTGPFTLAAPVIQAVGINPDHPTTTATLSSTVFSQTAAAYTYQWFQNGMALSGATASTLDLTTLSGVKAGDNFAVQVTPNVGPLSGQTVTFSVTIAS